MAIAILGALVGSFLNVVIHRLPRGESIATPRSRCPSCETPLAPWDNVPIVSWVVLRGRCRSCAEPISARYPVVEAVTAVAFAAVALTRGVDSGLLLELPFTAMLIAVAAIDLDHRIIPNRVLLPATIWALAAGAAVHGAGLVEYLVAGAGAFGFLLAAAVIHPSGMGMGDVKLAGVMGLFLGSSVVPALFVAFALGAVVGLVAMIRDGTAARKRGVPFAPFLALGGLVGILAGPELIELYTDHFLA